MDVWLNLVDWQRALCGAVLGAIFGSFIGALCSRLPAGRSIASGRSCCAGCGAELRFWELIPVLSFYTQNGRCVRCKSPIGRSQLFAELAAMVIGAVSFLALPVKEALWFAIMGWMLLPLLILDFKYLWLPTKLTAILAITGLVLGSLFIGNYDWRISVAAAAICWAALESIRVFYFKFRGIEGMGAGDPKLLAALALWTEAADLPMLLLTASGIGLTYAVILRAINKASDPKLPLGTFLAIAAMVINWPAGYF